ncbi:fused signal recognition particle receptor [Barrientosiimonas humi]|uniref:Signal recognition particle receptor FtsY n=1 Tax=Barrientosiimonas humi TaxID=999931 RepID=A0A542XD18_9MICO|nr:signal recognition particle-docking protein FtsY [Barrientosiimonas humi]TQL33743.1 fused signal recognition particle receptor [Barrientosiimonas humi]CAG7573730.1 Signal recognition particle receptor FtsY [Barrientosiimonas humi]
MDQFWEILLVITAAAVAGLLLVVGFFRGKGGRTKDLPPKQDDTSTTGTPGAGASGDGGGGTGTSTIERKPPKKNTYKPGAGVKIDTSGTGATGKGGAGAGTIDRPASGATGTTTPGSAGTTPTDQGTPAPGDTRPDATEPSVTPEVAEQPEATTDVPTAKTGDPDVSTVDRPDDTLVGDELVEPEEAPDLERPESARGRMVRLRERLSRSNSALGKALLNLLAGGKLNEEAWEEVEDTLLAADLGVEATTEVVDALKTRAKVAGTVDEETVRGWLHEELLKQVDPTMDRRIAASRVEGRPAVVLVVGVNGTGKTTTVGKLARVLVAEDKDVVLGAADTFRAAAADQLDTWGARVGVPTVRSDREGADPAAVAFDAVRGGNEAEADVVLIDTAGRLHNKANLMNELSKIKRVVEKQSPIDEVLLVIDATTGQNGVRQAEVFGQAVDVTGVVLTKLDGTAKGGIVVAVQRQLGVPVKLVGLGEGPDDLAPFDPAAFVDAVLD